jgi:hypothetical protein
VRLDVSLARTGADAEAPLALLLVSFDAGAGRVAPRGRGLMEAGVARGRDRRPGNFYLGLEYHRVQTKTLVSLLQ